MRSWRAWCADLLDALDAFDETRACPSTVDCGWWARRRGRTRSSGSVADLTARPVTVPRVADAVCLGATIQAAAVLHQRSPDDVADAWGVGSVARGRTGPTRVDAAQIRADYADAH